jgi:8-oxo-dGTP pyrophosphatase MutT (NUDIX family)
MADPIAATVRKRSAGVVVVRRIEGQWRYLVLRAYRNWDFPKGLVEAGEDALHTAIRETEEETGLRDLAFSWGQDFRETEPYAGGKVARYYLAQSPAGTVFLPVSPELGRPEHHEYRWLAWNEARRLLPTRLGPILDWARLRIED